MNERFFIIFRHIVVITLIIAISGCSMFRSAREIPHFSRAHLKVGYHVIVHTNSDKTFNFIIAYIDSKYIYGQSGVPTIKIENFRKLELYKADPVKITAYSIALLAVAMAFLVYVVMPTMGDPE